MELPLYKDGQRCGQEGQASPNNCTYQDFLCPQTVAWSPDEQQVAILSHCSGIILGASNVVLVYDAASGHLDTTFALDDLVTALPQSPNTCPGTKALRAYDLFWLPSGRLAIVGSVEIQFALYTDGDSSCLAGWDALILVGADGGHPQLSTVPYQPAPDGSGYCGRMWDVQSATPTRLNVAGADCSLAPALGYRWTGDGRLVLLISLSTTTVPPVPSLGPVGSSAGDAEFTVWQHGVIDHGPGWNADETNTSGLSQLMAPPPATRRPLARRSLSLPRPGRVNHLSTVSAGQRIGTGEEPLLPVRDAALQHILAALPEPAPTPTSGGDSPNYSLVMLAWRSDGALLATQVRTILNQQLTNPPAPIHILTCANGDERLTLTPLTDLAYQQRFGSNTVLAWSPDGTHLLLINGQAGTATLWDLHGLR